MDVPPLPAPRRTQGDRAAATRRLLVESATALLAVQGYGSATTAAIAERAQVTTGALHHHFGAKEDLLLAVLDAANERIIAQVSRAQVSRAKISCTATTAREIARLLVQQLWKAYGDTRYWAVWEIILGQRHDSALRRKLLLHRASSLDRVFAATMDAAGVPARARPVLRDGFDFTLHTIRGLLLERLLKPDATALRRQLDLLTGVLGARIHEATAGTTTEKEPVE